MDTFFEEYLANAIQGREIKAELNQVWVEYTYPYRRNNHLFKLWRDVFPQRIHLSPKVNMLNFVEHILPYQKSKLVVGRSIGIKNSEYPGSNTSYFDYESSIIELFKALYAHGDTIYNYVSSKNKAPLLALTQAIRDSPDFLKYIYPSDLKFKVDLTSIQGTTYYKEIVNQRFKPVIIDEPYIKVHGTPENLCCYMSPYHHTTIYESQRNYSDIRVYGIKLLLKKVIAGLKDNIQYINEGKGLDEIRTKLSKYILINKI